MIDTNIVISGTTPNDVHHLVCREFLETQRDHIVVCEAVLLELAQGCKEPKRSALLRGLARAYHIEPFAASDARSAIQLIELADARGRLAMDALIAACSQRLSLELVTMNGDDFKKLNYPHRQPFTS